MHHSCGIQSIFNGDVSLAFYMCVDNSIDDDGAKALAATLHTLTSLQTLNLEGRDMECVGWIDCLINIIVIPIKGQQL